MIYVRLDLYPDLYVTVNHSRSSCSWTKDGGVAAVRFAALKCIIHSMWFSLCDYIIVICLVHYCFPYFAGVAFLFFEYPIFFIPSLSVFFILNVIKNYFYFDLRNFRDRAKRYCHATDYFEWFEKTSSEVFRFLATKDRKMQFFSWVIANDFYPDYF